jgi:signal transduction histidine kinase
MILLRSLAESGLHFAKTSSQRRSILLSNLVSLILFGLGSILSVAYYFWYGWSVVTVAIPILTLLCLSTIVMNWLNLATFSRIGLTLFLPVTAMALSIYAKNIYYAQQEELDYFTFRFIILASCVFPAIFFSFKEKTLLIATSFLSLLILMMHDPLHAFFGVPYQKDILKESNYAFTNIVILITYSLMMSAVIFLKWISEKSEEKSERLILKLNQSNNELLKKNAEIEEQNQEISAQSENLNISQQKLQQAYELIEEQKNLLLRQNMNLSSELVDINKNLTETNTELIKHNNELRQFSYTVSHNLRGPVASLIGLINLMDRQSLQGENIEIYEHLKTSVSRLDGIISDLSQIIDIRNDIFHVRQRINLQSEIQEILHGFKKEIETYNVTIKTDFSKCPEIYSVKPMVHSILYNLISNAIKYRAGTRVPVIEISSHVNQHYCIIIKDNGLGIDLNAHENNLFKLYRRFHFHTEGKGLGLYLVRLQAETLGGSIEVSSEVNRQTTFTVNLGQPENIERQILYQKPYAKIFFDARINATGVVWHTPISSRQYRNVFLKCLEFVKVYNTPSYISDLSDQGHIAREDQQWMFREILPAAAQYGLRRVAVVKPGHNQSSEYLAGINDNLAKLGLKQEYFLTFEEAVNWIQLEDSKLIVR